MMQALRNSIALAAVLAQGGSGSGWRSNLLWTTRRRVCMGLPRSGTLTSNGA